MLHHIPGSIPPVVEELGAEDVAANTPNRFVVFGDEPFVAEVLRVEVVDFETAVVHVRSGVPRHEECMVVCEIFAYVDVAEGGHVFALRRVRGVGIYVEEVGWGEVKGSCVPMELGRKVLHAEAVVAELDSLVSFRYIPVVLGHVLGKRHIEVEKRGV